MPRLGHILSCALLLALSGQQLSLCAGWSSSDDARKACCERSRCDDPSLAAACCAAGEQDDHASPSPVPAIIPAFDHVVLRLSSGLAVSALHVQSFTRSTPYASRSAVLLI